MRILFYLVQLLDGFTTTRDNVLGRLPELLRDGGFSEVSIRAELCTMLGTMTLYRARGTAQGKGAGEIDEAVV